RCSPSCANAYATSPKAPMGSCTSSPTRTKAPFCGSSRPAEQGRPRPRRGSRRGQRHAELGAGLAVADVDPAAHGGRDLAHEREPDARAGCGARQLILRAVEELEDLTQLPARDARAEVADREEPHAALPFAARNLDPLALGRGRE